MILHKNFEHVRQANYTAAALHMNIRAHELASFLIGAGCFVDLAERAGGWSLNVKRGREAVHVFFGIEWTEGRHAIVRGIEFTVSFPLSIRRVRAAPCALPPVETLGQVVYDMLDRQARHQEVAA